MPGSPLLWEGWAGKVPIMAMKIVKTVAPDTDDFIPTPEKSAKGSTAVGTAEPEAVAADGSLRGFLAGFLNSQGVTSDGLPIPYNALPPAIARAVKEIADVKQVSEEMVFAQMLALGSAGVDGTHAVWYKNDWNHERGNLFFLVANPSGGGKSHSWKYIFKDVILMEIAARREYEQERKEWEEDKAIWNKMSAEEKKKNPMRPAPTKTKYVVDGATMAGLSETLRDNPRGMIWPEDEFSGFFQGLDGHTKTGSAEAKKRFLKFYDCDPWDNIRRSKEGESQDVYVQNAIMAVFGQVQTDLMREVFTERDLYAGLTARFLFVHAKRGTCPQAHDREISQETSDLITKITEGLYGLEINSDPKYGYGPCYVEMTPEAKAVFHAYYDAIHSKTFGNPIEEAFAQKACGQALRFALILNRMHNAIMPPSRDKIIEDDMRAATEIMTWFLWNLRQLWHLIPGGKGIPDREAQTYRVLEFVKKNSNFASEWHSTAEIVKAGLAWHGQDTSTQAQNLGGFLTTIITGNKTLQAEDVKKKTCGVMKYRLAGLLEVLEEMDARAK